MSGVYTTEEMQQASTPDNLPEAEAEDMTKDKTPKVRIIGPFEIEFLINKLDQCTKDFSDKVRNHLTIDGVLTYSINEKLFNGIMNKITQHLAEQSTCEVEVKDE